jgi:hypothetical protein
MTYFAISSCSDGLSHTTASAESLSDGIVTCMGRWSSSRISWVLKLEPNEQQEFCITYTIKPTTELAFK